MTKTFRDKLMTESDYLEAADACGESLRIPSTFISLHAPAARAPWWLRREYMRIAMGIYKESSVTQMINQRFTGQHCVHISNDDENLIAFTPSVEQGMQDRQVKMSLGKYLRKHFLLWSDGYVSELEASHRAEVSAVLVVAHSAEDIYRVYTTMEGDSGCMRHSPSYFHLPEGYHPSMVYATPELGVAYFEVAGKIKSRSVVYTNGDKKHYVRIYGDPILKGILARHGYVPGNLCGAELNTVLVPGGAHQYVMPYLDGVEGNQHQEDGASVALLSGKLRVLTQSQASRLGNRALRCKSQGGRQYFEEADEKYVSALSGQTFSRLDETPVRYWHNGALAWATQAEVYDTVTSLRLCKVYAGGDWAEAYCAPDVATFSHSYSRYIEDNTTRNLLGYRQLDPVLYPDKGWARNTMTLGDGRVVEKKDLLRVYKLGIGEHWVHATEVPALRKQGYVNCYYDGMGTKALIHKKHPDLRTSVTGVVFNLNEASPYVQLYDTDQWVNTKLTKVEYMAGYTFRLLKTDPRTAVDIVTETQLRELLQVGQARSWENWLKKHTEDLTQPMSEHHQSIALEQLEEHVIVNYRNLRVDGHCMAASRSYGPSYRLNIAMMLSLLENPSCDLAQNVQQATSKGTTMLFRALLSVYIPLLVQTADFAPDDAHLQLKAQEYGSRAEALGLMPVMPVAPAAVPETDLLTETA